MDRKDCLAQTPCQEINNEWHNVSPQSRAQNVNDNKDNTLQKKGGWETFIAKKTKWMINILLAIEGIC